MKSLDKIPDSFLIWLFVASLMIMLVASFMSAKNQYSTASVIVLVIGLAGGLFSASIFHIKGR